MFNIFNCCYRDYTASSPKNNLLNNETNIIFFPKKGDKFGEMRSLFDANSDTSEPTPSPVSNKSNSISRERVASASIDIPDRKQRSPTIDELEADIRNESEKNKLKIESSNNYFYHFLDINNVETQTPIIPDNSMSLVSDGIFECDE